jgi:hypothetical protein
MSKPVQHCVETFDIILIGETLLAQAESWLTACEHCTDKAIIPLDYVLDALTNCDPTVTEYAMCRAARCPSCTREITEKTLVVV